MKCTGLCVLLVALSICLTNMGHAQGAVGATNGLPSVESTTAMGTTVCEMDTAQIAETMRNLLTLRPLSYQDLPTVEYSMGSGLWLGPYLRPAGPAVSYTEKIALLEEALRIARALQAEEARGQEQSGKP